MPAAVSSSPEAVQPAWRPFAREITRGLDYFEGKISRPRLEFYALRIDLSNPGLKITAAGGATDGTCAAGQSLSVKVSTFVRENNLLAGINALPFDPVSGREGEPRTNVGLVIAGGVRVSPPHPGFDALVFYADDGGGNRAGGHAAAIIAQSEIGAVSPPGEIENAVGGFYRILEDGEPVPRVLGLQSRHPRSAAGISPEGKFLFLLVIDGRRPGSAGATEAETALLLRSLGAAEGINLDGGGSSSLALRYPDSTVHPVNTPIHGGIPGRERAVAGCLGVGVGNR